MREIKFRAWDFVRKRMLYNKDLYDIPYNEIFINTPDRRALNLMQYAGLKDIEGKEIYEGDIIKEKYYAYSNKPPCKNYGVIKRENKSCNLYVEWNFQYRYEGEVFWNKNELWLNKACEYEVIGNIYENPELLEGRGK